MIARVNEMCSQQHREHRVNRVSLVARNKKQLQLSSSPTSASSEAPIVWSGAATAPPPQYVNTGKNSTKHSTFSNHGVTTISIQGPTVPGGDRR
jgi:hypothetical protein